MHPCKRCQKETPENFALLWTKRDGLVDPFCNEQCATAYATAHYPNLSRSTRARGSDTWCVLTGCRIARSRLPGEPSPVPAAPVDPLLERLRKVTAPAPVAPRGWVVRLVRSWKAGIMSKRFMLSRKGS